MQRKKNYTGEVHSLQGDITHGNRHPSVDHNIWPKTQKFKVVLDGCYKIPCRLKEQVSKSILLLNRKFLSCFQATWNVFICTYRIFAFLWVFLAVSSWTESWSNGRAEHLNDQRPSLSWRRKTILPFCFLTGTSRNWILLGLVKLQRFAEANASHVTELVIPRHIFWDFTRNNQRPQNKQP